MPDTFHSPDITPSASLHHKENTLERTLPEMSCCMMEVCFGYAVVFNLLFKILIIYTRELQQHAGYMHHAWNMLCDYIFKIEYKGIRIYFLTDWLMFHVFCLHINSGSGLLCLTSLWHTHSSQDQEQSTIKLVFLQKANTMGITRPPSSLAKQVSRATWQRVVAFIITWRSFFHIHVL